MRRQFVNALERSLVLPVLLGMVMVIGIFATPQSAHPAVAASTALYRADTAAQAPLVVAGQAWKGASTSRVQLNQGGMQESLVTSTLSLTNGVALTADRPVFISAARISAIRSAIAQQRSPNYRAYHDDLLGECQSALTAGEHAPRTIYVPGFYVDRAGHGKAKDAIATDANNVYALGLCYRITDDERYAEAASRIIKAWATKVQEISPADDTTLVLSYQFPAMIFGADLIRKSSSYAAVGKEFTTFLQQKMVGASAIDRVSRVECGYVQAGTRSNNWSNWGIALTISIGAFTNDDALFDKAIQKWKENIAYQVDEQGNLPMEAVRNNCTGNAGVNYTNFAMQALSITAEIAANNGIDLFHYTWNGDMPYGRAWKRTAQITRYPDKFPFYNYNQPDYSNFRYDTAWFEIANSHFPNEDGSWILDKFRPMVSREVFRYGTLTHGDLRIALSAPSRQYLPTILH